MAVCDYEEALNRLINGMGNIVKGNYRINNDTVALEAGRKRGSIKISRYPELVTKIKLAEETHKIKHVSKTKKQQNTIENKNSEIEDLRCKYEAALNREAMLVVRLSELEKKCAQMEKRLSNVFEFPDG